MRTITFKITILARRKTLWGSDFVEIVGTTVRKVTLVPLVGMRIGCFTIKSMETTNDCDYHAHLGVMRCPSAFFSEEYPYNLLKTTGGTMRFIREMTPRSFSWNFKASQPEDCPRTAKR